VRLLPNMSFQMSLQVARLIEALLAHGTDEGSLSSMKPCMRSQGIRLGKQFLTERATVGFLSSVNFQVKFKLALM